MPDSDLPSLNENLNLRELNHVNFSIIIEDKHVVIAPKKKFNDNFDAMSMKSIRTNGGKKNNDFKDDIEKNMHVPLVEGTNTKKGFFSCFKCCLKQKN